MTNLKNFVNKISGLIKEAEDQEKLLLPSLYLKLNKAVNQYPEDQTLGLMRNVIGKMASGQNEKLTISRGDFKTLYRKLYSRNTKFPYLFAEELNLELVEPENKQSPAPETTINLNQDIAQIIDPVLAENLNDLFAKTNTAPEKSALAKQANQICQNKLSFFAKSFNVPLKQIESVAGNDKVFICQCSFETPKGQTSILVPVEINQAAPVEPNTFVGNDGPEDLTFDNLQHYLATQAGQIINKYHPAQLLQAITNAKTAEISSVDLAFTRLQANQENANSMFADTVIGQSVETASEDKVALPTYFDPEVENFARELNSRASVSYLTHGKAKVDLIKKNIAQKLASFGYKNHQISVLGSDSSQIVFAVSLNGGNVSFKIPVKTSESTSSIMMVNGNLRDFNYQNINDLVKENHFDSTASAVNSTFSDLKSSELVEIVHQAMEEKNLAKAEDALNVLYASGDQLAYKSAFEVFRQGLMLKEAESSRCSHMTKRSNSQYMICAHTGLPIHKVYQDQHGDCHPIYRRGMEASTDGAAYMMNHKIFI